MQPARRWRKLLIEQLLGSGLGGGGFSPHSGSSLARAPHCEPSPDRCGPPRRLSGEDPQPGWRGRTRARTHLAKRGAGPPLPSVQPTKFRGRPAGIARGPAADARALGGRWGAAADADGRGAGGGAAWAPSERPRAPRPPAGPAALHAPSRLPLASAAARRVRGAPSGEKLFPLQTKKGDT